MNKLLENNQELTDELGEELGGYVSAIKTQQASTKNCEKVEDNLQRLILAQGYRQAEENDQQTNKEASINSKASLLTRFFNWQPKVWASSMGAVLAVVLSLVFFATPSKMAFAQVISQMNLATSMFYSAKMKTNGVELMDIKVYYREPGHLRVETLPLGDASDGISYNVIDIPNGKGVIFFPHPKVAVPFDFNIDKHVSSPDEDPLYWYQAIKNYQGEPEEYLSGQMINGVFAEGFVINENGAKVTIWADVNNQLPVKLLVTLDQVNSQVPFSMEADLTYNQTFDDALFSLKIGSDYNQTENGGN